MNQIPYPDSLMPQVDVKVEYDSIHVDLLCSDWFPIFFILELILNSSYFHDVGLYCSQIQGGDFLYSTCKESYSFIQNICEAAQIDQSLCSNIQEFDVIIDPSNHNIGLNTYFSIHNFPMSVYNDNFFTFIDPIKAINSYDSSFHFSYTCQVVEALFLLLMVISGRHDIDMTFEHDHIQFPLQDSPLNSMPLVKNSISQGF